MFTTLSLQLDTKLYARLKAHLGIDGDPMAHDEAVSEAIAFWLAEPGGAHPHGVRGYRWKSLFLPEGTIIQSWSYGEHNYACVEGDQIIHEGRSVSPNQFAQSVARTTRNAWTDLFIRRPGDPHFKLATCLRQELAAQAKSLAPATPAAQMAPAAPVTTVDAISQLLAALLPQLAAVFRPAPVAPPAVVAAKRDLTPGPEWDLPERRKFRYRLEDVAFS